MKKLFFLSIYVIFFTGISVSFWSCKDSGDGNIQPLNPDVIEGEGKIITSHLSIENFVGVDLAFANNVIIRQGTSQDVKVTGHSNIIEKLKTDVLDNIWEIDLEEGIYENYELLVEITVPNLNTLIISGSGNMTIDGFNEQIGNLVIDISGSGQMIFNSFEGITNLDVTIGGTGSFIANQDISTLENLTIDIIGSGNYLGYNISAKNCEVNVSGAGNAEITVTNNLIVIISGSGNVSYLGTPISIIQELIGIGILINAGTGSDPCGNTIVGEGAITTQTILMADFMGIDLLLANNVTISQGSTQEVKITGHPNIIDSLTTDVISDIWRISLKEGCYEDYELSIEITVPDINVLRVSGSGTITVNNFMGQTADLSTSISGSGQIISNDFEGIDELNVTISGSGKFVANNNISTLNTLNVDVMGSGNYFGYNISSNISNINIFGSGNVEITTMNTLIANIFGSGNISYKGSPSITQNIVGTGQLINAN